MTPNGDYEVTLHLKQPRPGRYRQGLATPARRAVGSAAGDSKNTAGPACIRMREALATTDAHSESTGAAWTAVSIGRCRSALLMLKDIIIGEMSGGAANGWSP